MTGGHLVPENDPVGQPRKPCELTIIIIIIIIIIILLLLLLLLFRVKVPG